MQQYLHLLSNSGVSLPTDLWLPVTDKVKPQFSQQIAIGAAKTIFDDKYEISVEGYYKTMKNLIAYKNGESFIGATDWQEKVETDGKGWSYGAEVFLQKKFGKTNGWVGYTLSWTERQFENLNFGNKFPYRYDRRHDISVVIIHKINDKIEISGTWVYGTGNAVSFPQQIYRPLGGTNGSGGRLSFYQDLQDYGERNSFRMQAYHRLDVGVRIKKQKKWGESSWNFGLYNAYSRRNPFFIYLSREFTQDPRTGQFTENRVAKQVSLFPIIPGISWSFNFERKKKDKSIDN